MEPATRKLTIRTYKAQVSLRERMCKSLAKEFKEENITLEQKAKVVHQWDRVIEEKHAFQFVLDLLARQKREENSGGPRATSSAV